MATISVLPKINTEIQYSVGIMGKVDALILKIIILYEILISRLSDLAVQMHHHCLLHMKVGSCI